MVERKVVLVGGPSLMNDLIVHTRNLCMYFTYCDALGGLWALRYEVVGNLALYTGARPQ